MAFGIGTETAPSNAGKLKGDRKEIACQCWFTSKGDSIPLMIKFIDEQGSIRCVKDIEVLYSEKKYFAGIQTMEYGCKLRYNNTIRDVNLIFMQEECKWIMLV